MNLAQSLFLAVAVMQLLAGAAAKAVEMGRAGPPLARAMLLHFGLGLPLMTAAMLLWPDWFLGYAVAPGLASGAAGLALYAALPPLAYLGASRLVLREKADWVPITAGVALFLAFAPYLSAFSRTMFLGSAALHAAKRDPFAWTVPGFAAFWLVGGGLYVALAAGIMRRNRRW